MTSLALPFPYSAPISLIALDMFWFNLPSLQPTTSLLVFLKALFLVLFFSHSTPLLSAISLITPIYPFIYTLMILSSTSPFLALILPLLYHHYLKPLIPSILGLLLIDSLLITKLNICSLELNNNVQKLQILH